MFLDPISNDVYDFSKNGSVINIGDLNSRIGNLLDYIGRKELFLFNDALNTFYLRLYGVIYMVKDHSDSERGNLLLPHRLLFPINTKCSFICTISQTG